MSEERNHTNSEALKEYLFGSLSEAKTRQFEEAMEQDAFEKEALEGFNAIEDKAALLAAVKSIEKSVAQKTGKKQERSYAFPIWKISRIAASVVLLIVGAFLVNQFMKTETQVAVNTSDIETEAFPIPETDLQSELLEVQEIAEFQDIHVVEDIEQEIAPVEDVLAKKESEKPMPSADDKTGNKETTTAKVIAPAVSSYNFKEDSGISEFDESDVSSLSDESVNKQVSATEMQSPAITESRNTNSDKSFFDLGMTNYNAKDYNKAIDYFLEAINNKNNITAAEYYIAMSYYDQNKLSKSLKYFDSVIAKPSSSLANNAKWYKAIILEAKGSSAEAIKLFQELANGNSGFKNQAQDKLDALN
jgi:tetratricopeptide (TPR) repeat protein